MEAIQRGARAIDRILDGIGFYWEMNECDDWGGGWGMGPLSICKGKDNKQNSKTVFLKYPHIRLLEFACLN